VLVTPDATSTTTPLEGAVMAGKILHNLTGQRFGDWLVLKWAPRPAGIVCKATYWLCRCACGHERAVRSTGLMNGRSTGCGCSKNRRLSQRARTHGQAKGDTYRVWQGIQQRCHNEKNTNYWRYGARGIRVCDQWRQSFETFLADVGERPSRAYSLDRIDNDKGYEPGNVRWATRDQQRRNMRSNVRVTVADRSLCLVDLETLPIATRSLLDRMVARGMTGDEILTELLAAAWHIATHPCA
jgi:hypothetical protein